MEATYGGIALTGEDPGEWLGGAFAPSSSQTLDDAALVRAARRSVIGRGGREQRLPLKWRRQFASSIEAIAFAGRLEDTLPDSGDLVLSRGAVSITMAGAVMRRIVPTVDGAGVDVEAEFAFGQMEVAS